jgi:glycine cleavage system H lipoate-binding protein
VFPWNYGFVWNAAHVIFLGAFYAVLVVVAVTVLNAVRRSKRDLRGHKAEAIRWHSDFGDLLPRDRVCRHVLTGELQQRECPNAFDCRHCEMHAKLTAARPAAMPPESEEDICGMAFPLDRYYHRGHTWARPEPDGTVTVGLDDLGRRLLGSPDEVDLPAPGAHVEVNGTAFRVKRRDADVRVLSPVDGEVMAVNASPEDWVLKVKPDATGEGSFRHLLRGAEIAPWIMREMERLQLALAGQGASATLADGGVPVTDIAASCPEVDWSAVCGEMFLEP